MSEPEQETAQPTLRQQLVTALGLPTDTFMLELLLSDTMPIIVRCHYYPTPEAMQRAVAAFAEYQIVSAPKPEEPGSPQGDAMERESHDAHAQ